MQKDANMMNNLRFVTRLLLCAILMMPLCASAQDVLDPVADPAAE